MNTIIWLTEDCLHEANPARRKEPEAPAIFVFEEMDWSLKRIGFVYECLLALPATAIHRGGVVAEVTAFAHAQQARRILTVQSPEPRHQRAAQALAAEFNVEIVPEDPFVEIPGHVPLARFSRYWSKAEKRVTALLTT